MELAAWFAPMRLVRIAVMLALGIFAITVEAAPLGLAPEAWPSPDILYCIVAYWAIRRPDAAPVLAVFAIGLARDLLTDLPVGAGALSLVLVAEFLKKVGPGLARRSFATEWALVALLWLLMGAAQWLVVLILLAHPPYLVDLWDQFLATMALYPLLAMIFRWLLRVGWRKIEEG
jgi:rod shape-determining protein MreD